jgi:hypothetical protein
MFSPEADITPLTVQKMIEIQKVRGLVGRPFIMSCTLDVGESDLESLRNGDINGLVVDLSSKDKIAKAREMIDKLPRRKHKSGPSDIVPMVTTGFRPAEPAPEPDDDDDDDDF